MRGRKPIFVVGLLTSVLALMPAPTSTSARPGADNVTVIEYDSFEKPGGYTLVDYFDRWTNKYGPGEMAVDDTRAFDNETFFVGAVPFRTGADFSVFDHIKYLAISNESFAVPAVGSIEFSAEIAAETPGTEDDHVVDGTYGPAWSYPIGAPYAARVLRGQQAGATLHMIDFYTGQLFDWFIAGDTAFTLIERLPSSITGSTEHAGREEMYTQIIKSFKIAPGVHEVAIRYTRDLDRSYVEYFFDGRRVSKVNSVGVPLDVQNVPYTGTYPSLGPGEILKDKLNDVSIGHGLFSLLDAFPFQHPEAPELSVSIPLEERLFGQGARANFDNFTVTYSTPT